MKKRIMQVGLGVFCLGIVSPLVPPSLASAEEPVSHLPSTLRIVVNPGADDMESLSVELQRPAAGERGVEKRSDSHLLLQKDSGEVNRVRDDAPLDLSSDIDFAEVLKEEPGFLETMDGETPAEKMRTREYPDSFSSEFSLAAGMRVETLNFSIAGLSGSPDILSELEWDDVSSYMLGGELRWTNNSGIYLLGKAAFGSVASGENQDSDFAGDRRTLEFSRSYSDTGGGSSFDGSVAVGYRFDFPNDYGVLRLVPLAGFSMFTQQVEDSKARQAVSEQNPFGIRLPEIGSFPYRGINKTYDTKWSGPWIGLEAELIFNERHRLRGNLGLHYFWLGADGDWKLRSDLSHPVSFHHDADGTGVLLGLNYAYSPAPRWFFLFGGEYRDLKTHSGSDWVVPAGDVRKFATRLNEVESEGYMFRMGVGYRF